VGKNRLKGGILMKIYNKEKTKELFLGELDLDNGRLIDKEEVIHHEEIQERQEKGHYQVVAQYPNGGKDIEYVIDIPAQEGRPAYDEYISYQIYVPYSKEYLHNRTINRQIENLKQLLSASDYKVLKRFEGYYTDEEFEVIKEERRIMRETINELESQLYEIVPEEQEGII
jgi:hypothetical protein